MKTPRFFLVLACTALTAFAKNETEITLAQCPAAVQGVIQQNIARAQGTLEKIEREKKDGVEIFDAKIVGQDGRRWTLKVAADGKVIEAKQKEKKAK